MLKSPSSNPNIWKKKPQQQRAINTANSIIQAASEVFSENGFHNTKADDIAKRAGVGIASLYDYFPNKVAIAMALLEKTTFTIVDDTRKIFLKYGYGDKPFSESLPHVVHSIYNDYKSHQGVLIDLVSDVPELRESEIYSIDRLIHQASLIFLRMYFENSNAKNLHQSHAFINLVFSSSIKTFLSNPPLELSENEFLDDLCQIIINYLISAHDNP